MNSTSSTAPSSQATTTTSQTTTPIIIKKSTTTTARRQSLRSYLKDVSLSDAILPHPSDTTTTKNNNNHSPEKKAGKNRRRRLEVMGLLQHLKIHRYEKNNDSSFVAIVDSSRHHNTTTNSILRSDSLLLEEDDTVTKGEEGDNTTNNKVTNNNDDRMDNTTAGNTKTTTPNKKRILPNTLPLAHRQQRCLLHPTVRLRNDKCSLCNALAKTLEVRRIKLLESSSSSNSRSSSFNSGGGGGGGSCNSGLLVNDTEDNVLDTTASSSAANGSVQENGANSTTIVKMSTRHVKGDVEENTERDEGELHVEIMENHSLELGEGEQLQLINDGISKLQMTIALAKGALDSKSRQQQQDEGSNLQQRRSSVSSPSKRRGSYDAVVVRRRCSSSGGSHGSDTTTQPPLPLLLREVVVVPATTFSSSSDVSSVKSTTSDLSTLTSSTVGSTSLGSHSLGRKLGNTTRLPRSKVIGEEEEDDDYDDDDDDASSKANQASRTVSTSTCDTKSEEDDDGEGSVLVSSTPGVTSGKSSCSVSGSDDPKTNAAIQSKNVIVEDVYSDEENEDGHVPSTKTVQMQSQPTANDEEEEGNHEEMIDSETGTTSVATPKRKEIEKEDIANKQSPSLNSVAERPSTTTSLSLEEAATTINDTVNGGTVDQTLASQEERNKGHPDSFHANPPSHTGENSRSKNPSNQFSEVERRLSRVNQRLSRSTTRRDSNDKRSSRSRSRSIESKIPFFAALVEHARSRSNSRTRRRSRSRSVTREGGENASRGEEKKLESRQRSKSRSVQRCGRDDNSSNKQEKSGSRSRSERNGANRNKKTSRGRSRSISVKEKSRFGSTEKKKSESDRRGKVVSAKEDEEEDCSNGMASEHKHMKKAPSSEEVSPSPPDCIPPDPFKLLHLPNLRSMTVKALKAELNLFKVDYSTFNEKEQFIAAVRRSRETSPRPQSEVTSMKLKELKGELAIYDVDYCNFREKSEFVEALKNAREAEQESVPQQTVVPPKQDITEEPILTVVHREPITHPRYKLGDEARDEDMIIFPTKSRSRSGRGRRRRGQDSSEASSADEEQDISNQSKITASIKELHHLDAAFIRRSDGRWTYAIVADGDDKGIRFVHNKKGATKILTKEMWKKNVRRIKVLTQRKGDVLKVNRKPPKKRRDMRRSISKKKGRLVSPSPTRNFRYRKLDVLSVPPTITEDKVFVGKGKTPEPEPILKRRRQYSKTGAGVNDALPEWARVLNESGLIF